MGQECHLGREVESTGGAVSTVGHADTPLGVTGRVGRSSQ